VDTFTAELGTLRVPTRNVSILHINKTSNRGLRYRRLRVPILYNLLASTSLGADAGRSNIGLILSAYYCIVVTVPFNQKEIAMLNE